MHKLGNWPYLEQGQFIHCKKEVSGDMGSDVDRLVVMVVGDRWSSDCFIFFLQWNQKQDSSESEDGGGSFGGLKRQEKVWSSCRTGLCRWSRIAGQHWGPTWICDHEFKVRPISMALYFFWSHSPAWIQAWSWWRVGCYQDWSFY